MWWNVCTYRPEDINLPPVRAGVYVERYNLYVHMLRALRGTAHMCVCGVFSAGRIRTHG